MQHSASAAASTAGSLMLQMIDCGCQALGCRMMTASNAFIIVIHRYDVTMAIDADMRFRAARLGVSNGILGVLGLPGAALTLPAISAGAILLRAHGNAHLSPQHYCLCC